VRRATDVRGVTLTPMPESPSVCSLYPLEPLGPVGRIGRASRLTILRGTLVGKFAGGRVATYIETSVDSRIAVMWPGEYRGRLDPLEILNERGDVVATEGESVQLTGGHLPGDDPRLGGRRSVFFASMAKNVDRTLGDMNEEGRAED
jgi:hypothetical protein